MGETNEQQSEEIVIEEKPQNSSKKVEKDKKGRFVKGHTKVGGAVIGSKSFTTKVRNALEKIIEGKDYTYEEAFIKSILKKGIIDGDSTIIRLIWNYLDGMPAQKMDLTSMGEKIIPIYGNKSISGHDSDQKNILPNQENKGSIGGDGSEQDN